MIRFESLQEGALGGGGTAAVNGGVIAAGFDAAFVLTGLGHYDTDVVVTLELSVKFLSLARADKPMAFILARTAHNLLRFDQRTRRQPDGYGKVVTHKELTALCFSDPPKCAP